MLSVPRRRLLLLPLLSAVVLSYVGAFLLRFDFAVPSSVEGSFRLGLCVFIPIKGMFYGFFRLHASRWRRAGLFDLNRIVIANVTASAAACVVAFVVAGPAFPRSVYIIDAALCFLATAGIQFSIRVFWEVLVPNAKERGNSKPILIYGAGEAGLMLGREIRSNTRLKTRIVGFLDDDECKQGGCLIGAPILGTGREAAHLVARFAQERKLIAEIIIAMPSATALQMRAA